MKSRYSKASRKSQRKKIDIYIYIYIDSWEKRGGGHECGIHRWIYEIIVFISICFSGLTWSRGEDGRAPGSRKVSIRGCMYVCFISK